MTILGFFLITLGIIVGASWLWIFGIVVAAVAVTGALLGKHTRLVAGHGHYS